MRSKSKKKVVWKEGKGAALGTEDLKPRLRFKFGNFSKKSSAQLQCEIDQVLAKRAHSTRPAHDVMTARQFNALATRASETLRQDDFEVLLAATHRLRPRTIIGVRGDYGGVEKIADGRFIQLVETNPIVAPWSRQAIVEEIVPGSKRSTVLRRLDVSPYDLRATRKTRFFQVG